FPDGTTEKTSVYQFGVEGKLLQVIDLNAGATVTKTEILDPGGTVLSSIQDTELLHASMENSKHEKIDLAVEGPSVDIDPETMKPKVDLLGVKLGFTGKMGDNLVTIKGGPSIGSGKAEKPWQKILDAIPEVDIKNTKTGEETHYSKDILDKFDPTES